MKKFVLTAIAALPIIASASSLAGFHYGNATAPGGHEWQSPDSLAYNKEQPRATFWYFESPQSALQVLPDNSRYYMSLNGDWSFRWVKTPDERPIGFQSPGYGTEGWDTISVPSNWNIAGLQPDGSQRYGKPIYVNQPVIFWHQVKPDDWRGGVMRTPPEEWTTFEFRNEVGSYRRNFTIPESWKGRRVYINFDGVDSFFYLWINGRYVGFSKNSRNAARFDITPYLNTKGENTVAVEVYRNSDGSFLEAQDMFRLPGIFRSVALYSTAQTQITDLVAIPDLGEDNGSLDITAQTRNFNSKNAKGMRLRYSLYANELYSDRTDGKPVAVTESRTFEMPKNGVRDTITTTLTLANPKLWSAEQPWRYTLVAELLDKKGNPQETVATFTGFRKVEVRQTPASEDEFGLAGRYFYINGQPVKLKGVNRHETSPERGHAITRQQMEQEVMLMKRANINHVRNSHYPDDPYWYYLCDKYGIYLEDEANLESHEYYYGDASLSHVPEWEAAHVARNMELVHSTVNSPSVVIWSLGNEAGPGKNFVTAYNAVKEFDPSRPVQYERNNSIVDIGSNQYPSIAWTREAVKGEMNIKYPFHISEYAHSMGNAVGNLVDYWNAIESTNHFIGGAIWDWVDQSLYNHTPEGTRYLAFGGDFGDTPSDGQFVMNGIVFGDLTPKPQYAEVKKVYQNVAVTPVDLSKGEIEIFNKNYFTPLDNYTMSWQLLRDGVPVKQGNALQGPRMAVGPRERMVFTAPYSPEDIAPEGEYFLNIEFRLASDTPWAKAGYVQMAEQLPVKGGAKALPIGKSMASNAGVTVDDTDSLFTVTGSSFKAVFDKATATLRSLSYGNEDVIVPGHGPELYAFRAYMNNDNWAQSQWFNNGLYNLKHRVTASDMFVDANGNTVLAFSVESQAPRGGKMTGNNGNSRGEYGIDESASHPFGPDDFRFITNQMWTIYPDGSVELGAIITSNKPNAVLPRLGYQLEVPARYSDVTYYGRGPEENYADRLTGQFFGRYTTTVDHMFTDYTRPQSNGNREDVRWAALTSRGNGLMFVAPDTMAFTAIPYTEMELFKSNHPYRLPASDRTVVHLDCGVTGLGGNSCGQGGPLEPDRVRATEHRFSFIIRPVRNADFDAMSHASATPTQPIGVSRANSGIITISCANPDETVLYTIDNARKPQVYTGPFEHMGACTIKAWLKSNPAIAAEGSFPKLDRLQAEAFFASSQEPDYGEAAHLTDGDIETVWHTMYSVTVAQFPHWVDFDAGSAKRIKGVAYTPRQDGNITGTVKEYRIYISNDAENWGEPVAEGVFSDGTSKKTILFDAPVEGRYIRFMALNSQDGRDYASGAEFEVLAE